MTELGLDGAAFYYYTFLPSIFNVGIFVEPGLVSQFQYLLAFIVSFNSDPEQDLRL